MILPSKIVKTSSPSAPDFSALDDLRFRALLSDNEWESLPTATQRRFSTRLAPGETAVYVGTVVEARFSTIGWWFGQITRLIGGPLPTGADIDVPSVVTVTEDAATSSQVWTRLYARRHKFPQVIHSSIRFAGHTGLEEYVGFGIGMALRIAAEGHALRFRSAGYFLQVGRLRLSLPQFLTPGALTATHTDLGGGNFQVTLEIIHPLFGMLLRQSAVFRETTS